MSRYRRFDLIEHSPSFFLQESTSIFAPRPLYFPSFPIEDELDLTLDLLRPDPCRSLSLLRAPPLLDEFDAITDLIQIERTPFYTSTRRAQKRVGLGLTSELYLRSLSDRVSALELGFDRVANGEKRGGKIGERKYTWTTEIKSPEKDGVDRKYKWTAEMKDDKKKKGGLDKNYKFTAEVKGKGEYSPISRTYTFKASNADEADEVVEKKEKKKDKKKSNGEGSARIVEIEEASDHGALVLRQAFAKRVEKIKGKRKELSPEDAAARIQMTFRAYLIRRSQALRSLRELAIAKNKLKELRSLFNNFSYRRRVARDAEERQRFSEKIIVLLLTVDAIEGADLIVRSAKKSMVDELEAMLDVVDPQLGGKSFSRRRTFDMPDGIINKELTAGVSHVVQMLNEDATGAETLEAFL